MQRPPCSRGSGFGRAAGRRARAAWDDRLRPSSSSRSSSRAVGPEMPRAATTSPRGPWTGTAMPVRPTSSSSRVTAQPRLRVRDAVAAQRLGVGDRRLGELLQLAVRDRQRAPGVEDLAERGGVRRDLDLGPVAGAEQVAGVDLGDLHDLLAAGHARGARSRGCPRRSAPCAGRASRTSSSHGSWRAAYSQKSEPATYDPESSRSTRRCAPARSASARSSTSRGRWPPGGRRR